MVKHNVPTLRNVTATFIGRWLNVALEDFESEKMRLESLGLKVDATVHEWLHVRSLTSPTQSGVLSLSKGEFAGVSLLQCKRGIEEMLACTQRAPRQVLLVLPPAEAHRYLGEGHAKGKVVVTVQPDNKSL